LYGGSSPTSKRRSRIHYGTWGGNLFQSIYDRTPSTLGQLPLMPEWYLVLVVLALLAIAGSIDGPLFPLMYGSPVTVEALLFAVAIVALVFQAARAAWLAPTCRTRAGFRLHSLTALLFLLQPLARLAGRMRYGLSPWRRRGDFLPAVPRPRNWSVWSERWRSHNDRLLELEHNVRPRCMSIVCGGDYDRWDIQARLGPLGAARLRLGLEEHGHGQQLVRYRIWPRWSRMVPVAAVSLGAWLAASAAYDLYLPLAIAAAALFLVVLRAVQEAGAAVALMLDTVQQEAIREQPSEDEELLEALRPSELLRNRGLSKHLDRESVTIESQ